MGFGGPGLKQVGSRHLADAAVVSRVIKDNVIGSSKLDVDSVYSVKVEDNTLGYGELTTGLQGSLGAGIISEDQLWLHFEHGRIGSITGYDPAKRNIGSVYLSPNLVDLAFASDNKRLWGPKIRGDNVYIFEVGTTTGNIVGSFKAPIQENYGVAFAPDNNRMWLTGDSSDYIYEMGTATGNIIGSFAAATGGRRGLAFASDKNRLWHYDRNAEYIFELGTITGNKIGSIPIPYPTPDVVPGGLTFASDKNRLWWADRAIDYMFELGTTTGAVIGSLKAPYGDTVGLAMSEKNRLWDMDLTTDYLVEIGTAYERAAAGEYVQFQTAFGQKPDIAIAQIGLLADKSVFIEEPALGSFFINAGTYPAKAMWMAWGSRA